MWGPIMILIGVVNIYIGLLPNPPGATHWGENLFGKKLIPWDVANTAIITLGGIDIWFGIKSFLT
jgi:hypothetical protein